MFGKTIRHLEPLRLLLFLLFFGGEGWKDEEEKLPLEIVAVDAKGEANERVFSKGKNVGGKREVKGDRRIEE
uniref:Secreted protein n=1 Tax=Vespula pensylvanica TaxID=30213 RepID=A0A834PGW3_VESPE|nr:hypothetical protein H0235_001875 [Vespula pensylvanica]